MIKDIKKTEKGEAVKKPDTVLNKVVNIRNKDLDKASIKEIADKVIDNPNINDNAFKKAAEDLVANSYKAAISSEHPELYKFIKDKNYQELNNCVDKTKAKGLSSDTLTFTIPDSWMVTNSDGTTQQIYSTSFSISPNSFWANITNILNEVSVGDNFINTGDSFNAWTFYRTETLASGEAALRTIGQTLSGICLLNQNQLVPSNTQMLKGYQASLGVFINEQSAANVGGGVGLGMFTMYSTPINVIKLAVTNPQQFSEMVRIFQATAINTREYSLWLIATYNMLSNITNIIIDNFNTNIRNCLNGTLFPAIQIMKNPTNEFNCGLIGTGLINSNLTDINSNSTYDTVIYSDIVNQYVFNGINNVALDSNTITTYRYTNGTAITINGISLTSNATINQPYLVPGSATNPRIQTSKADEMYLIVSPEFLVGLKSGTLSQLFHWEFQRLEEYIPPENIRMLYKQINIPAGYLQDSNIENDLGATGYAYNVAATLGDRWFPKNCIYLITKPTDINQWTANYGYVWTAEMTNEWGAGMISTSYLHYALYGGVLPWANGACFYFKNLMNLVSDSTQAVMYDFTLNTPINQKAASSAAGSGSN